MGLPYICAPNHYDEKAPDANYTGQDYWTFLRRELDKANKEFARRMEGKRYEDDKRAR